MLVIALVGLLVVGAQEPDEEGIISVSGDASIDVAPDQAQVSLGVVTRESSASGAMDAASSQMQDVVDAILEEGIPPDNIQTQVVSLYPVTDRNGTITGFEARNIVAITITNINQTGPVIDSAIDAGASEVQGVSFTVSPETREALRDDLLRMALDDAEDEARVIADAMGVRITGPVRISTTGVFPTGPVPAFAEAAVPISPGVVSVSASVSVDYAYQ